MAEKKEYINIKTPFLRAYYPRWDEKDVYEGKETAYVIKGIAEDEGEFAKFKAEIEAAADKLWGSVADKRRKAGKKTPLRENEKDSTEFVTLKTYKPPVLFGPKGGVKLPPGVAGKVGAGTVFRAELALTEGNGHIVGYVNGIQIKKLIEKGSGGFDDLEDADDLDLPEAGGFGDADGLDI